VEIDKIRTFGDFTVWGILLPALLGKYTCEKRIKTNIDKLENFKVF